MNPSSLAARRKVSERIVRECCGNDGGLMNAESSPHVMWLAAQLEEAKRC